MEDAMAASIAKLSKAQIATFFSVNAPATQKLCDQEAERLMRMPVHPAPVQGGASYTIVSDDESCVVQFRSSSSALDMGFLECVERVYDGFMPRHQHVANLGRLHVYTMGNVGGISMYLARGELYKNNFQLLRRTLSDYARFFASAWHKTPSSMQCPSRAALYEEYASDLKKLQQGLPIRFRNTLDYLISKLPGLFSSDWPLVPNHTDLLENNIHVSPETGHLAGICDWKDTTTMLGIRSWKESWIYHANQQELRDLFWDAFYKAMGNVSEEQKELIEVARLVGLFLDNGFRWIDDETKVPASEGHPDLRYLEAVTLKLWAPVGA
ncbi:hypothetical protein FRC00_013902 [Tulasnella sp. 408]|nr:hypothetical protein FRC00_013902 [Tulasnella sp. 408]